MTKRTQKVGITGKYGVRYGSSLRKRVKKIATLQRSKYVCPFCAKQNVRRSVVGVWNCNSCNKTIAGGAYTLQTDGGKATRASVRRSREALEAAME